MALVPSRQFYPTTTAFLDSFHHSSIYKLHVTRGLQFVRYGSSCNPFKKHKIIASYVSNYANSNSNPRKRSKLWSRSSKNEVGFSGDTPVSQSKLSASGGWLEKWDDIQKQNWPKPPQTVLTYRNSENVEDSDNEHGYVSDNGGVNSGSGTTMERIVEKMKKFGYVDDVKEKKEEGESREIEKGSIEDMFYVEEGMLPNARGGFSPESPLGVEDVFRGSDGKVRFPWEKPSPEEEERRNSVRLKSKTFVAELTLPESELRRLRNLAFRTKKKTKIGGAGVSQDMVNLIKDKWKSAEVVNLKIEGAGALNMKRMHETLERKTGGLVIWRSGSSVALYRGLGYMDPSDKMKKDSYNKKEKSHKSSSSTAEATTVVSTELEQSDTLEVPESDSLTTIEGRESTESETNFNYEAEVDKLLEGLGPRYTDWPGGDPLPVDADLLPGVVQDYQPPFRILPYGVKSVLVGREATALRRLARFLPPHFALGRSRQHQGLAAAIMKLWEKSSVAKVALKRGVQLTTSERMAEDIKKLTGGMLLSRNKDFLVFYRGKDFLSPDVTEALLEKERLAKSLQDEEEQARLKASSLIKPTVEIKDQSGSAGTLGETLDADARWGIKLDDSYEEKVLREAEVLRHSYFVRKLDRKLRFAHWKLMKAEQALSKVESSLNPADCRADPESITDEERFMFRKLGLRMKAFLLLGRRGVFDGTVENMHLHWKYRELVKIIVNEKSFEKVKSIALSLESESGGVLVSVDKVSKGYAIVVFRGKDYKRPPLLRPKNLLTKRKALARSIELQRREALLNHISTLQRRVDTLRSEIEHISSVKGQGNEELYDRLDAAYSSEDEDNKDQGEEMYLETYDSENEVDTESNIPIQNNNSTDSHELEKEFPYDFYDEGSETNSSDHQLAVSGASRISQNEEDI